MRMCIRVSSPLWIGCWYFLFSPPCLVFGAGGVVAELIPSEEPLWEKGEEPAETWTMLGGRLKKQGEGDWGPVAAGSLYQQLLGQGMHPRDEDALSEDRARDLRFVCLRHLWVCRFCVGGLVRSNHTSRVMLGSPAAHPAPTHLPHADEPCDSAASQDIRAAFFFSGLEPQSGDV